MTLKDFFKDNGTVAEWQEAERVRSAVAFAAFTQGIVNVIRIVGVVLALVVVVLLFAGCTSIDPAQVYWNVEHEAWLHTGDPTLECVLVDTTSGSPYCHEWTRVGGWIPPYQEVKP